MQMEDVPDAVPAPHQRSAAGARAGAADAVHDALQYSPVPTCAILHAGVYINVVSKLIRGSFNISLEAGLGKINGQMFHIAHLGVSNELILLGPSPATRRYEDCQHVAGCKRRCGRDGALSIS